jgi:hypothetical protein
MLVFHISAKLDRKEQLLILIQATNSASLMDFTSATIQKKKYKKSTVVALVTMIGGNF